MTSRSWCDQLLLCDILFRSYVNMLDRIRSTWSKVHPFKSVGSGIQPPHNRLLRPRGHIHKARRFRSGTVTLREIRKYQKSGTKLLISDQEVVISKSGERSRVSDVSNKISFPVDSFTFPTRN